MRTTPVYYGIAGLGCLLLLLSQAKIETKQDKQSSLGMYIMFDIVKCVCFLFVWFFFILCYWRNVCINNITIQGLVIYWKPFFVFYKKFWMIYLTSHNISQYYLALLIWKLKWNLWSLFVRRPSVILSVRKLFTFCDVLYRTIHRMNDHL